MMIVPAASESNTLRKLLEPLSSPAAGALCLSEAEGSQRCLACAHRCLLRPNHAGICQVRINRNGAVWTPHGYVAGYHPDPIEKKPFYHVIPGSIAFSFGMYGCNLHCNFCQNWLSSQALRENTPCAPPQRCSADALVQSALHCGARSIISTYNEPAISAEWAFDIFSRAQEEGLYCGFVSNGHVTPELLEFLMPVLHCYKVDLKAFSDRTYREMGCRLGPILDTIGRLWTLGVWVEVVTLVIPGLNDSDQELRQMAHFLADVSPDLPWHVTAFHPAFKEEQFRATTAEDLLRARQIGLDAGLHFVYAGNRPGQVGVSENTYCPNCHRLLIERQGFRLHRQFLIKGACPECHTLLPGIWS